MSNFFGGQFFGGGFHGAGAGEGAQVQNASVVLFPVEPLHFRRRADKTLYAWAMFMQDMRAPTYVQAKDRLVSIQQAMRA